MAIYVKYDIGGRELLPNEILGRKIEFANYLAGEFDIEIDKRELWKNEYIESLGGELIAYKDSEISKKLKDIGFMDINYYVHKMEGALLLGDKKFIVSLISHNRRNSKIYGDLELRIYNKDVGDLIFNEEFKEKLLKLIKGYKKKRLGIRVQLIVAGESPDALIDVRKRYFSYHGGMRSFIEDLLKTIKIESEEMRKPLFDDLFKPYNLSFIAASMEEAPQFSSFISDLRKRAHLSMSKGSVICVAEKENSFEKIYELFRDDFIKGAGQEWPNRDKINSIIKNWIGKHKPLDEFPSEHR